MTARFMTDPDQMWAMAGRFEKHAQALEAVGLRICDPSGNAEVDPTDMHWAFRNVVTMLRDARDGLVRSASRIEAQEQVARDLIDSVNFPADLRLVYQSA